MGYGSETRNAYGAAKAADYRAQLRRSGWMRFTMDREKAIVRKLISEQRLSSTERILDMPCGTGVLAPVLADCGAQVIAADISHAMLTWAQREYACHPRVTFAIADACSMPFKDEAFEGALVIGFLHRLSEDVRLTLLRELRPLVREFLIVSYSADSSLQRVKKHLIRWVRRHHESAPHPVAKQQLEAEFATARFRVERTFYVAPAFSAERIALLRPV